MPPSPDGWPAAPGFLAFALPRIRGTGLELRLASPDDLPLIAAIYATTREEELRQVTWGADQKKAFTDWQSQQQEAHYATHYPAAERLVVLQGGEAMGRLYVDTTPQDVRLMEMTLLPAHRNHGVGSRLMEALLAYAAGLQRQVSLHVEPFNPAKRMYERLGFQVVETRGIYEFMVRPARQPS